jgi:hypothetical protein
MIQDIYRFEFFEDVSLTDIEETLLLAIVATESLHGESQARLDVGHYFDPTVRACVIDAGTAAGRDLNRLFVGFLRREYGDDSFRVQRTTPQETTQA